MAPDYGKRMVNFTIDDVHMECVCILLMVVARVLRVLCRLNDVLISTYARPTEMPATMVWYTAKMPRGLRCG